jgi:hypothetical protein
MDELDIQVATHLVVRVDNDGMYYMSSRHRQTQCVLTHLGDTLFDARGGSDRKLH